MTDRTAHSQTQTLNALAVSAAFLWPPLLAAIAVLLR
jgi:hypothetical protein